MPLIADPRHSPADLERWASLEAYDRQIARGAPLARAEDRAMAALESFVREHQGECYAGTSWGKDSTVVAHLVHRLREATGLVVPVVYVRVEGTENPLSPRVRDVFLDLCPGLDYHEIVAPQLHAGGSSLDDGDVQAALSGFAQTRLRFGRAHISGVRAEESGVRKLRMKLDGESSRWSCRPIGWWRHVEVFAYLAKYDLPVHPAYAMAYDGQLDRKRLRVSALAGRRCVEYGRELWDRRYFPEEMRRIDEMKAARKRGPEA